MTNEGKHSTSRTLSGAALGFHSYSGWMPRLPSGRYARLNAKLAASNPGISNIALGRNSADGPSPYGISMQLNASSFEPAVPASSPGLSKPPIGNYPTRATNALSNMVWPEDWPYTEKDLKPQDSFRDEFFYLLPKLVQHAAEDARARLTEYYDFVLPSSGTGSVLDLCSSWTSHYPAGWKGQRVVAIGLNAAELALNPSKTEFKVQNLNIDTRLPFDDEEFDLITNSLSADYLTSPLEIFREMRRVLKTGGIAACAFTNRCFPTKVVPMWLNPFDDIKHIQIIGSYFHYAGFSNITVVDMCPEGWAGVSNPMYVVQATKT